MDTAPQPRLLCDAFAVAADALAGDDGGAVWRLTDDERDLDSNVVHLVAEATVGPHLGPDIDVLLLVLAGGGELTDGSGRVQLLQPGGLVWLPRRTTRRIAAGPVGLSYLTVHRRRPKLAVGPPG